MNALARLRKIFSLIRCMFAAILLWAAFALPFSFTSAAVSLTMLFNCIVAAGFIGYACFFLKRRAVDNISIGLFILSAIVSLHYLHISVDHAYTNDIKWHLDYISYVQQNWLNPYGYSHLQSNHPPLYYYIAAATLELNKMFIDLPKLTVLRFLSWVCFLAFHVFNLLTLRRGGFSGVGYYACAALLLLWPGNAHLASKINSEALYYAVAAASFYYTILWYQEGRQHDLMKALIAIFIALTVRANAVILCTLIGSLVLIDLYRERLSLRMFFNLQWAIVALVLLGLATIIFGNIIFHQGNSVYDGLDDYRRAGFPLTHYLSLGYSFENPFYIHWDPRQHFLEYVIKTSVFGEYKWPSPGLAIIMNYGAVAIGLYTVLPLFFTGRAHWRGLLPYALYAVFSLAFLIYFSLLIKDFASQDARYIYPALICFVVFFGKSHAFYSQQGLVGLSRLGPLLVLVFTLLSTYFFWNNFR